VTAVRIIKIETSLKTDDFGLKPGNRLVFNCPDLKVGAIDIRDIQGFSPINFNF
jgi:ASC-1-like (ASCH) protein